MAAIEIRSLTKWYGSARGIEDITFDIEQGEIFGYLGPNGSGKTTTIRCIMGLLRPTSGQVNISGSQVVPGKAVQHKRIGYLPGDFRIWPSIRARTSLQVLASLGDNGNARKKRLELAERLELDLNRYIWHLSKGNRQKVGIIYAFQHEPDVVILDEPTIGLDPLVSQTVLELIREAAEAGATVLLSSHDLNEVSAVCGRAAILREGQLVELSDISKIVQHGKRQLKVWFAEGSQVPNPPINNMPGVQLIERKGEMLHIAYEGDADAVLKWIAQYPTSRISTYQTSLEDAFMKYYRHDSEREGE